MKKMISVNLFLAALFLTLSAQAMTTKELTAKVISDNQFMHSVETDIRNIFSAPGKVKLKFESIKAKASQQPRFIADFKYEVEADEVEMGLCSFSVSGIIQSDSSIKYEKMVHQDCGE